VPDETPSNPSDEKPPTEGETLLEVGGVIHEPAEIGQPSIYADSTLQRTLLEVGPEADSQAETRRIDGGRDFGGLRYELKGEVGRGGMGVIMRAHDRDLKRDVALKLTRADQTGSNSIARFVEEAQITGQLSHPNIVPVHELGHEPGGRTYFTMKLVEGRSLAQIVRALRTGDDDAHSKFPLARRLYIFSQMLNCMAYAHDRGVVHRDLKPDNVMIGDFGEVLVMDWGLAKVRDRPDQPSKVTTTRLQTPGSQTLDGTVIGTPAYMPPEQARGERDSIDERSDIYSLGAILYELLALRPPYEAATASDLIRRVTDEPPPPPSVRNPGAVIPRGLERIVMRCLDPLPAKRYQRVQDLQHALETYNTELEASADEGLFFALFGKTMAFALVVSSFIGTAVIMLGSESLHFREHLIDPGVFSALITVSVGTLAAWLILSAKGAFDATHAILLWKRAGIHSGHLRGFYTAEACRRAKWMYMVPVYLGLGYAFLIQSPWAGIVVAQMLGASLLAVLGIGAFEQGAYRKLDVLDAMPGQDRRDRFWRWGLVILVLGLAVFFMDQAGWERRVRGMPEDFRRGTLVLHLAMVLAGVWVTAQIGHPFREVNRAMRTLFSRRISPEQRRQVAPMAHAFASNALIFGAIGTLTWIGLISPGWENASVTSYLMALTPLWSGILWSWFFRSRGGKVNTAPAEDIKRRFLEYRKHPQLPGSGMATYFLLWMPLIVAGLAALLVQVVLRR